MKKYFISCLRSSFLTLLLILSAVVTGAVAAEPKYGGTLTILEMSPTVNPMSWDVIDMNWKHGYDTGFYMEHLLMGDLQKGPRGTKQYDFAEHAWIPPEVTQGELVEKWEVKKNPLQIIFHLRKGIMWQEKPGVMKARELTAEDVVYSFTRMKTSRKAIPDFLTFIDRFEIKDPHTLIVHLKEWNVEWYYRIGWGNYDAIQAPEQEKAPGGAGKWENATGTGPYMITEYKEGHSQIYTKNPKYWGSETINGKKYKLPFTDKIVMMIIRDEATQIASLRTGKLDLVMAMNWKNVSDLKKTNPQLQWAKQLTGNNFAMAMRMDKKPFDDIRVRRAMNLAINRREIIDKFYGGNAEMHTYPFPPTFKSVYTPMEKLPPSARELFSYNPEKAKKLLVEAGYPNGFTFKAQIPNVGQTALDIGALVAGYLAKIGVTMELETMDYPSSMSTMMKKTHPAGFFFSNGFGGPFNGIWKNFSTGFLWNPHMMSDPYLDKTHDEITTNQKLTEKQALEGIKKLAVYALDQAPAIILPTAYNFTAWWPWVKNYYGERRVGGQRSGPIHARIWIDQEMKKKMGY
jgi:peptide/nickel transport system substrate-binding protein